MKTSNLIFAILAVLLTLGMLANAIVTNNRIMERAERVR